MGASFKKIKVIILFILAVSTVSASDPDILSDFIVFPPGNSAANLTGSYFTFSVLREMFDANAEEPSTFKATKVSLVEFAALIGQSVSLSVLQFPAGSVNPPHSHPRSAELLFVVEGSLDVGFVDTTNQLFSQTLQVGDVFIFPKGLIHFQFNSNSTVPAAAFSAFGSANAGTVSMPKTVFATGIDDNVLANSFKTDVATIQKIKAALNN